MNLPKIVMPFKREVWENQASFFGVFLALGALLVVLAVFGMVKIGFSPENVHIQLSSDDFEFGSQQDSEFDDKVKRATITGLTNLVGGILYAFVLISALVTAFYLLGSLFDDRKDRSILFWKSMPVSEIQSVATKFLTGVFTIPIIAAVIGLVTAAVLALALGLWIPTVSDFGFLETLSHLRFFESFAVILVFIIVSGVWIAPFSAWLMLASSISRKSPLLWALAPPFLIIFSEKLLTGRSTLIEIFHAYLPDLSVLERVDGEMSLASSLALTRAVFFGPEIYLGIVVTGVLLAACVWLRNNRYEL